MTNKEFIRTFISTFAKGISESDKKKHRIGQRKSLLWDIFAAKLVQCYSGNKARKKFDTIDKTDAIEIRICGNEWFEDDKSTSDLSIEHMTAKGIDDSGLYEFYVVGKDYSWCYVVTHEFDSCGPYFCYKP